jgi:glycosyltransferase involved in cell wall biosynthesis
MTQAADTDSANRLETTVVPRLDDVRVLVLFGGGELFGQERANIEVFRTLREVGLKARFVTSSRWGAAAIQPELRAHGFEWTRAPFGFHWGRYMLGRHFYYVFVNLWGVVATSWRVWREIKTWRATHIYAPNWAYWFYAAPAVALTESPLIFRAGDQLPRHTALHRWTGQKLLARVNHIVCNSQFVANKFRDLGVSARKLRVIYNRAPQRAAGALQPIPKVEHGTTVIVFIGQISEHKGAHLFVQAAKRILADGANAVFWLVGESAWQETLALDLKREVVASGRERQIRFLGYRGDIPQVLHTAHIHVCPSMSDDAAPNVVMEAKEAGLPSVVFPVGGLPELVEHSRDGYLCSEKTVEALVEGIRYFMADSAARIAAGEAAQRSLDEKFAEDLFAREWTKVFVETRAVQ